MVGSKSGSSTVSLGKNPYPACYLAGFFPFSLSFSLTSSEKNPSTHNLQEFCCSLGHSPAAWLHHCIYLYLTPSLTKKITRCRVIYGVCYQLCETLKYAKQYLFFFFLFMCSKSVKLSMEKINIKLRIMVSWSWQEMLQERNEVRSIHRKFNYIQAGWCLHGCFEHYFQKSETFQVKK